MIGKRFKHYEITGALGEGGMGVVYRALDTRLNRPVALKFVSPQRVGGAEERRRLENEARSAAALRHPNICTIYDIDETPEGQVFISMACLEGESVRDRVQRIGRLPLEDCLRIVRQVAEGLREAHAHGVIHRDIKSANILLTDRGEAVILDFGLAKLPAGGSVTQTDAFSGTVAYAAPEQIRGERVDARADLWSLGVVWYEMLTGTLPFNGNSVSSTMHAVLEQELAPLRALRPDVPAAMDRALGALLVKDPRGRTPDAAALLAVLAEGTGTGVAAAPPGVPSIAVLPFANMSADPEQTYFCDGIAEDIINDLARIRGVRVLARSTSFAYRDAGDVRELGRRIGVGSVLEGSVRKAGNRLRITAQLVDVASGSPIWSERWDRETSDVFAIQDEIARATVSALRVTLTPRDEQALARTGTQDVQAYDLFLQGRNLVYGGMRGLHQARVYLQAAVDRDPDFARAHAVLALAGVFVAQFFAHEQGLLERSLASAERALALDPDLAEAHTAVGQVSVLLGRQEAAEAKFREALRLNPDLYEPRYFYGRLLFIQKRWSEVPAQWERAIEIDPEEFQCACMMATVYRELGWPPERRRPVLERAFQRAAAHVARRPDAVRALYLGSGALFEMGRRDEAMQWVDRAIAVDPSDIGMHYNIACTLAVAGEKERALHHLERSLELGFIGLDWLDADPDLASLRDDPRFRAMIEKRRKK